MAELPFFERRLRVEQMTEAKPFRVLSLDGGGMRGTYSATYLAKVAETFAARRKVTALDLGAAFDLIVGTSTGGIIACALAKGVPLSEIATLYRKHGPSIFRRPVPTGLLGVVPDIRKRPSAVAAGAEALRQALLEKLGPLTIGEVYAARGIALSIPAVEMGHHAAWVFKTPHLPGSNHRDDNYSLVDVCMATSAAPVFRSMAAIDHPAGQDEPGHGVFVDGGLWANNPILVALIDALDMTVPGQRIEIFAMGTCPSPVGERIGKTAVNRGLKEWRFGSAAAELSIDAQQFAFDHMARKIARHVNRDCRIVRFPAEPVPATVLPYLRLDDVREEAVEALVHQARRDADMTNSRCSYRATDAEAELICSLFESAPARTQPPVSRRISAAAH